MNMASILYKRPAFHALALFWFFSLILFYSSTVLSISIPHGTHRRHGELHHTALESAWRREQAEKAEIARRSKTCPNLPTPIDLWLDYSVKVRAQQQPAADDIDCPSSSVWEHSNLKKRDYTCDENTPCSNGRKPTDLIH